MLGMKREVNTAMKINTINYFLGDAFKSLKRNKTISLASMITVFITFFVLGIFTLAAQNANLAIAGVEDKIEIQVFLDEDIKLIDSNYDELVFVDVYYLKKDLDIDKLNIQKEELKDVKWVSLDKIKKLIEQNNFFEKHIDKYQMLLEYKTLSY